MSSNGPRLRRQRERLFKRQKGLCVWCGKPMQLLLFPHRMKKPPPPNACTIEHLESRWHPKRGTVGWGSNRLVAACWKCNNDRDKAEVAAIPKELIAKAARGMPAREVASQHARELRGLHKNVSDEFRAQRLTGKP